MTTIRKRLLGWQEILPPVFGTFCFFCFSWTLYRLFWYIPSWLEYLSIWKVMIITSYVLAFALVESAVMTVMMLLILLFVPGKVYKGRFSLIVSCAAMLVSVGAFLLQRKISLVYRLETWQILTFSLATLLLLFGLVFLLSWLLERLPRLSRIGQNLVDRMTIFMFIYAPLGLLGLIVVIIRNLIGF